VFAGNVVSAAGSSAEVSAVQPVNTPVPSSATVSGKSIVVSLEQPLNALAPMYARTESSAKVTVVRLVMLANALAPISCTLAGMEREVMYAFWSALSPIFKRLLERTRTVFAPY
jgi:hypothetical protein